MSSELVESCADHKQKVGDVCENAVAFVEELEELGFKKHTLRFEGQLSEKELLSYKSKLIRLINSVENL